MERVYAGDGPARTEELNAWLIPTEPCRLRIADDKEGSQLWLTSAEQEAAARKRAESARLKTSRAAVEDLCEAYGVPLDDTRRAHLDSLDADALESLRTSVKRTRSWPL